MEVVAKTGERHGFPWDGFEIEEVQLPDENDDYGIPSDVSKARV